MKDWLLLGVTFALAGAIGGFVPLVWFYWGVCF